MAYDCDIHHRRSIRLKDYDYSQNGAYFLTICTKNREIFFEDYPILKKIIRSQWENIPNRFPNVELDEFVIMPNHLHGIIIVGATFTVAQNKHAVVKPTPTIGEIVGSFKSLCVNEWLEYINKNKITVLGKFWQHNYYEHVVRNDDELNRIREYIINNPLQWQMDENNPKNWAGARPAPTKNTSTYAKS